ncbi:XRE family transcriptional regulator [Ktedonosporobacter rubrisoli]|uniref:XRE family transcriptional regulator n=1 Tax=Ktedonosporobacter rubrisoli TaxID=2509675 RepID=A0A4P6JYT6_KTERU|nr:helix-turn-helix transcriptional regulator [Ktedonosporobacter rubrisoli]QBD80907.1 XRE family transcriptional regulator [Ktedonosporobacter rubrisoli]
MIRLKIKEVAEQQGLSMAKLARRADMDFKTVQRIFHDPYRDISLSTLDKLAEALKIPASELIETVSDPAENLE